MAFMAPMIMIGVGVLLGTVVMTAQAVGAGSPAECGGVWRVSMIHGMVGTIISSLMPGLRFHHVSRRDPSRL